MRMYICFWTSHIAMQKQKNKTKTQTEKLLESCIVVLFADSADVVI